MRMLSAQVRYEIHRIGRNLGAMVAFAILTMLSLAPSTASAVSCPNTIAVCCTIAASGAYTLSNNLSANGSCINVMVPNVNLNLAGFSITNIGTKGTGIGIHVLSTAPSALIVGASPITGTTPLITKFNTGIQSDATNVAVVNVRSNRNNQGVVFNGQSNVALRVTADSNTNVGIQLNVNAAAFENATGDAIVESSASMNSGNGIVLNGANSTFIFHVNANSNNHFGIWLKGASSNNLDSFTAELNGNGGVYLGCHASGPTGTLCLTNSMGNNMVGNKLNDPTTDSDVNSNTNFGVAIEIGSRRNHVMGVAGTGNPTNNDAIDENPGCGNDVWVGNSFTSTTPALNTTPICIN